MDSTQHGLIQSCLLIELLVQRVLRAYAGKLIARLPKTAAGSVNATAAAGTTDWHIKMADEDIPVVCTIVSTAEYCNEIVGSLGRSVAKMLDPPFGDQVCPSVHAGIPFDNPSALSCTAGYPFAAIGAALLCLLDPLSQPGLPFCACCEPL